MYKNGELVNGQKHDSIHVIHIYTFPNYDLSITCTSLSHALFWSEDKAIYIYLISHFHNTCN